MKLQAPYSKGFVEATGELAELLIAKGFTKADEPKPKRTTRKAAKPKEQ